MRYVTIELRPTDGETFHPVGAELATEPSIRREAIHNVELLEDGTMAMLAEASGDLERYAEILENSPDVLEYSVSGDDRGVAYSHIDGNELTNYLIERRGKSEFIIDWPVEITEDGAQRITLVGDRDAFASAEPEPPDGTQIEIVEMGEYMPEAKRLFDVLTERQQETLRTAVDVGYYRTPREATIDDVADAIDCAPGTAGEHLRKIEARVFQRIVG